MLPDRWWWNVIVSCKYCTVKICWYTIILWSDETNNDAHSTCVERIIVCFASIYKPNESIAVLVLLKQDRCVPVGSGNRIKRIVVCCIDPNHYHQPIFSNKYNHDIRMDALVHLISNGSWSTVRVRLQNDIGGRSNVTLISTCIPARYHTVTDPKHTRD